MSLEREEMELPRVVMSVMPGEREGREGFLGGGFLGEGFRRIRDKLEIWRVNAF